MRRIVLAPGTSERQREMDLALGSVGRKQEGHNIHRFLEERLKSSIGGNEVADPFVAPVKATQVGFPMRVLQKNGSPGSYPPPARNAALVRKRFDRNRHGRAAFGRKYPADLGLQVMGCHLGCIDQNIGSFADRDKQVDLKCDPIHRRTTGVQRMAPAGLGIAPKQNVPPAVKIDNFGSHARRRGQIFDQLPQPVGAEIAVSDIDPPKPANVSAGRRRKGAEEATGGYCQLSQSQDLQMH